MKKIFLLLAIVALFVQAQAQEKWSLEKCIDYALSNNIVIKQYQINTEYQKNLLGQSKNDKLPWVSADLSHGFNFGRSVTLDNTYDNYTSSSTSISANANITIWSGGILKNTITQYDFELKSSLENLQKAKDDITLSIASGYLDILFAQELIKVAEKQTEQTKKQIDRTSALVEVGKIARGTLLEVESQLAREELDVVNRNNNLQIAYLNLAQFLELDDYTHFKIEVPKMPEIKAQASIVLSQNVFEKAVEIRPEIKSAEYELQSTEIQLKIAKSAKTPSLSAYANASNYHLSSKQLDMPSFNDQIRDNLNENVGLSLSIPIFSRFQNQTNISNAKLQIMNQKLELESAKKELRRQIEQAYTNAVAALKSYNANKIAVNSMQESFRYIEEKYSVGRVNAVEYNAAKTNLANAESALIQSKYDFIFRSKILDFYNGIPIKL